MLEFINAPHAGVLAIFGLGYGEIALIILIILLLFGARKLPELAKGLAKGMRLFKNELKGVKSEIEDIDSEEEQNLNPQDKPQQQDKTPKDEN